MRSYDELMGNVTTVPADYFQLKFGDKPQETSESPQPETPSAIDRAKDILSGLLKPFNR